MCIRDSLLGADNLVGDKYDIEFVTESGQRAAWLRNRFGAKIGFFDADFSRQLSVIVARGWTVQAVLSFVAYTDRPAPGRYWGEVAVICFDPALEDAFGPFVDNLSRRLADGVRPEVELGEQGVAKVVAVSYTHLDVYKRQVPARTPAVLWEVAQRSSRPAGRPR